MGYFKGKPYLAHLEEKNINILLSWRFMKPKSK